MVIQPTHMDSSLLANSMLCVVLFWLKIEQLIPELKNKLDQDEIIAAGHSMGAATAMLVSGITLSIQWMAIKKPRF